MRYGQIKVEIELDGVEYFEFLIYKILLEFVLDLIVRLESAFRAFPIGIIVLNVVIVSVSVVVVNLGGNKNT